MVNTGGPMQIPAGGSAGTTADSSATSPSVSTSPAGVNVGYGGGQTVVATGADNGATATGTATGIPQGAVMVNPGGPMQIAAGGSRCYDGWFERDQLVGEHSRRRRQCRLQQWPGYVGKQRCWRSGDHRDADGYSAGNRYGEPWRTDADRGWRQRQYDRWFERDQPVGEHSIRWRQRRLWQRPDHVREWREQRRDDDSDVHGHSAGSCRDRLERRSDRDAV